MFGGKRFEKRWKESLSSFIGASQIWREQEKKVARISWEDETEN